MWSNHRFDFCYKMSRESTNFTKRKSLVFLPRQGPQSQDINKCIIYYNWQRSKEYKIFNNVEDCVSVFFPFFNKQNLTSPVIISVQKKLCVYQSLY